MTAGHAYDGPLLEVSGLSVGFAEEARTVEVTSDVSFSIAPSAVMRLLPHPAGRILAGSVRLEGREVLDLPTKDLYALRGSSMAMIFQEPMTSLNPVHTALDQVVEVLRLHRPEVPGSERRAEAVRLLEEVDIQSAAKRASSYPFQLSGGMRQRVMIAMALAGRPRLLIADEPTTALDVTVQAQILDLLRRVRSEHGMGMLYITHDMSVVAEIADRVVVMYAGQVVETGAAREVFERPLHPYTTGLLACSPRIDSKPRARLQSITGTVPAPVDYPAHCRFSDRCPLADEECRAGPIELRAIGTREDRCIKVKP